jgi:hypothetical protein
MIFEPRRWGIEDSPDRKLFIVDRLRPLLLATGNSVHGEATLGKSTEMTPFLGKDDSKWLKI